MWCYVSSTDDDGLNFQFMQILMGPFQREQTQNDSQHLQIQLLPAVLLFFVVVFSKSTLKALLWARKPESGNPCPYTCCCCSFFFVFDFNLCPLLLTAYYGHLIFHSQNMILKGKVTCWACSSHAKCFAICLSTVVGEFSKGFSLSY